MLENLMMSCRGEAHASNKLESLVANKLTDVSKHDTPLVQLGQRMAAFVIKAAENLVNAENSDALPSTAKQFTVGNINVNLASLAFLGLITALITLMGLSVLATGATGFSVLFPMGRNDGIKQLVTHSSSGSSGYHRKRRLLSFDGSESSR